MKIIKILKTKTKINFSSRLKSNQNTILHQLIRMNFNSDGDQVKEVISTNKRNDCLLLIKEICLYEPKLLGARNIDGRTVFHLCVKNYCFFSFLFLVELAREIIGNDFDKAKTRGLLENSSIIERIDEQVRFKEKTAFYPSSLEDSSWYNEKNPTLGKLLTAKDNSGNTVHHELFKNMKRSLNTEQLDTELFLPKFKGIFPTMIVLYNYAPKGYKILNEHKHLPKDYIDTALLEEIFDKVQPKMIDSVSTEKVKKEDENIFDEIEENDREFEVELNFWDYKSHVESW